MNSRERMLAAINRKPVDRIPTDIWATGEVWAKLRAHFGESADIGQELHIDGFAGVGPEYIGPALPSVAADESVNFWGIRTRRIPHEGGAYMDMTELKKEFGGRVCFHGAVENQRILPFGTPEEVRAEVRHCIDALASDGTGYILAPCHNLQVNTSVENIIAMYDEAWTYGKRS